MSAADGWTTSLPQRGLCGSLWISGGNSTSPCFNRSWEVGPRPEVLPVKILLVYLCLCFHEFLVWPGGDARTIRYGGGTATRTGCQPQIRSVYSWKPVFPVAPFNMQNHRKYKGVTTSGPAHKRGLPFNPEGRTEGNINCSLEIRGMISYKKTKKNTTFFTWRKLNRLFAAKNNHL